MILRQRGRTDPAPAARVRRQFGCVKLRPPPAPEDGCCHRRAALARRHRFYLRDVERQRQAGPRVRQPRRPATPRRRRLTGPRRRERRPAGRRALGERASRTRKATAASGRVGRRNASAMPTRASPLAPAPPAPDVVEQAQRGSDQRMARRPPAAGHQRRSSASGSPCCRQSAAVALPRAPASIATAASTIAPHLATSACPHGCLVAPCGGAEDRRPAAARGPRRTWTR